MNKMSACKYQYINVRIASQVDLGARTISPSKCLKKYARENKETEIAGIQYVKGANIKPLYYSTP